MKRHIPNTITILNLLSGCMALIAVAKGELISASWWIILAAFLDLSDGLLARLLDARSEIGKQLDSLADVVSFGVAPGMILYVLTSNAMESYSLPGSGWQYLKFAALLVPAFSALRLAKFNIDEEQTYDFKGLPTPVSAFFILSIPIIINCQLVVIPWLNAVLNNPLALAGIALLLSFLMVSRIHLFSMKVKSIAWRHNRARFILILAGLVMFFSLRFASVPFIIILYIILSQFRLNDPVTEKPAS